MFVTRTEINRQEKQYAKARIETKASRARLSREMQKQLASPSGIIGSFTLGFAGGLLNQSSLISVRQARNLLNFWNIFVPLWRWIKG